jgi:hypothetical protein
MTARDELDPPYIGYSSGKQFNGKLINGKNLDRIGATVRGPSAILCEIIFRSILVPVIVLE